MLSFFVSQIAQLGSFRPPVENEYTIGSENDLSAEENAITNIEQVISNTLGILTIVAALFFVFQFVIGSFNWITSGGDSGKLSSARNRMLHSAIGLILVVAAYAVVGVIGSVVGLDILMVGDLLRSVVPN